jgi:predicted Zn-dependent protease
VIVWLHIELAIARGDGPRALAMVPRQMGQPATGVREPLARPAVLIHAAAALAAAMPDPSTGIVDRRQADPTATGALADARQALLAWTAEHPRDALAWEWLGRCAQALDLPLLAQRALAERLAAAGDFDAAIDRLLAAQSEARAGPRVDFIEASIIDARLRQLQAQRRAWADELRRAGSAGPR